VIFIFTPHQTLAAEQKTSPKYYQVVLFGDSITWSWRAPYGKRYADYLEYKLQNQLGDNYLIDVAACGNGGNTAKQGLARLQHDCIEYDPDMVIINFGANDAFRDFTPETFDVEFRKLLQTIKEKTNAKIIIETIPTIDNKRHSCRNREYVLKQGGLEKYMEPYNQKIRQAANDFNLPLHDRFVIFHKLLDQNPAVNEKLIRKDGIHMTIEGNEYFANTLAKIVIANIKKNNAPTEHEPAAYLQMAKADAVYQHCLKILTSQPDNLKQYLMQNNIPHRLKLQRCRSLARRAYVTSKNIDVANEAEVSQTLAAALLAYKRSLTCSTKEAFDGSIEWGLLKLENNKTNPAAIALKKQLLKTKSIGYQLIKKHR
jgi:lysophospholipase L1-like esterase